MVDSLSQSKPQGQVVPLNAASNRNQQLAALDLGSNSFHLIVAQESQGRIQILDKHKEMVRLAEGLGPNNELDPAVAQRALDCLERLGQRLRTLRAENVRIVGTNTLRQAERSSDFVSRAEALLGHPIEIISGREEARLIYLGVCHDIGVDPKHRLVVDIGGGSTELIIGRKFTPLQLESLHMGCVSMSQRHFGDGKLGKQAMQRARSDALLELEPITNSFVDQGWQSAVGTSGTINAVAEVIRQLLGDDWITAKGLADLQDALISAGNINSLNLSGLANERKAVFAGGVAILSAIFEALEIDSMSAAQSALREGLIYDILGRQHEDDVRHQTVTSLIHHYRIDEVQARQVRETALALLSQVAMDWQLAESEHKHLISWAADLHELGMDISHSGFHKHGSYLIEAMDMPGFSRLDQRQLATLVRTHRRKINPSMFAEPALLRLAALLRVAVVLHRNRSHELLPHIQVKAKDQTLTLSLPAEWLTAHPLTEMDLDAEAQLLSAVDIKLVVSQH